MSTSGPSLAKCNCIKHDLEMSAIAKDFQRLSHHERKHAYVWCKLLSMRKFDADLHCRLTQILSNLNADEWRHVRDLSKYYPLQYDILAALPLELVAHVFSFLEVADVFQYRQVSYEYCFRIFSCYCKKTVFAFFIPICYSKTHTNDLFLLP
jgi:hypothetical protein